MSSHEAADASLYHVVHRLLTETDDGTRERRDTYRHDYPGRLLVAPYVPGTLPDPPQLHQTRCCDLSPNGFSFLLTDLPLHESWVVALGQPPTSFFLARAQNVTEIYADGTTHYRIGCQFTQRLTR